MTKITVTVGMVNGKPVVLKDPSTVPEEHLEFLRELTDANGVIKSTKTSTVRASEAAVIRIDSANALRTRKFK